MFRNLTLYSILLYSFQGIYSQKVLTEFSFNSDFQSRPTFYEESSPRFVNANRWIYIGKTADFDEAGIYFYDLSLKDRIFKPIPLEAYYLKNPTQFLGEINPKTKKIPLTVYKFLFYEEDTNRAGFLVENRSSKKEGKRYYFFGWNLTTGELDTVEQIYEIPASDTKSFAQAYDVGYNKTNSSAFFIFSVEADLKEKETEDVTNLIFKVEGNSIKKEFEYKSKIYPYNPTLHEESGAIVVTAYAENYQKLNPMGFYYKINTKAMESFPIPSVPYGVCFSKDGSELFIASADTGEIRKYNTSNFSDVKKAKWGTHGHRLGFWKEGELVWARNSGLHIYDPKTLKQKKVIPTKKFYKNHVNVSGSEFLPFQMLLLRNGLEDPTGGAAIRILTAD
jgi:hypothetical protein